MPRTTALFTLSVLACMASRPPQSSQQEPATGWRAGCRALPGERDSLPLAARRCAELFVRVNGYTDAPGTKDTTEIVLEHRWFVVLGPDGHVPPTDWSAIVASRRGQLRPAPVEATCSAADCLVIFEYADPANACRFRALVLSLDMRAVGFAHQDILPRPDQLPSRCREDRQAGHLTGA